MISTSDNGGNIHKGKNTPPVHLQEHAMSLFALPSLHIQCCKLCPMVNSASLTQAKFVCALVEAMLCPTRKFSKALDPFSCIVPLVGLTCIGFLEKLGMSSDQQSQFWIRGTQHCFNWIDAWEFLLDTAPTFGRLKLFLFSVKMGLFQG